MNDKTIINIWHLVLTEEDRKLVNDREHGGWDASPKLARYASLTCMAKPAVAEAAFMHGDHTFVATVETDDLNEAYRLTNHITESWQFNNGVTAVGEARTRAKSSSVGDIFEVIENGRSKFHVVTMHGFEELDLGPHQHGCMKEGEQA